ncbi:MAG: OmpH family outer membrane protein [Muribaculaceae bacterium]|nr:OmpH family outer membrane protein [Muribaculaceae bacterium]
MNFLTPAKSAAIALCITAFAACNNQKSDTNATTAAAALPADATKVETVIRYIDEDSLLSKYNLAKELNEAMIRRSSQYESAERNRGTEIQNFGNEVQKKYQNNAYLSQESFESDRAKLEKMQADAQNYLGRLQQEIQNEMIQNNIQLNDSVNNYLKIYAKEKGFSVILRKSATMFIDPAFDVTLEVVEGLNKRYTKVEKK